MEIKFIFTIIWLFLEMSEIQLFFVTLKDYCKQFEAQVASDTISDTSNEF